MPEQAFFFGPFELFPEKGLLVREGSRIPLGSRALSILDLFVRRPGELVTVEDLRRHAWPNTSVEESNLRVQLSALRRALLSNSNEARYIVNESGRGYRFVAEVERRDVSSLPVSVVEMPRFASLPTSLVWPVGRDDALTLLLDQLSRTRLLTITGSGGVGKTTIALTTAARLSEKEGLATCFVDLSSVSHPDKVSDAVANALHLSVATVASVDVLGRALQGRELLLLLDNCEHVIEGAADVAERLLGATSGLRILATSREPLRCHGESLHKLSTLPVPTGDAGRTAESARTYAGVKLFLERALAMDERFVLSDANAPLVSRICQQLDGLPLALELGAATASVLGLENLASGLDDRLPLLGHGPRVTPRHRTLRAMLDWSYDLLAEEERAVLVRLSIFRGLFSLDAGFAVAGDNEAKFAEFANVLGNLASKSLIAVVFDEPAVRYRLLDTTRAYCAKKLDLTGERAIVSARHATFVQRALSTAQVDWRVVSRDVWWSRHGHQLDDVRAALDWAFAQNDDIGQAIAMTILSAPLWLGLSQLGESRRWIEQAISALPEAKLVGSREEMQLCLQLGMLVFYVDGPGPKARVLCERALDVALSLEDVSGQVTARWALVGDRVFAGDYKAAASISKKLSAAADGGDDLESKAAASRIRASTEYYLGCFVSAASLGEHAIEVASRASSSYNVDFRISHLSTVRANQAICLWMLGQADQARELISIAIEDAISARDTGSLVYVLSHIGCPLALWLGETAMAERIVRQLIVCTEENALQYLSNLATWYFHATNVQSTYDSEWQHRPKAAFSAFRTYDQELLATLVPGLVDDQAVARAKTGEAGWASAEILRAQGEKLRTEADRGIEAEAFFLQGLEVARRQGALAWELRCATSLGRLLIDRGDRKDAIEVLGPVIDKFTEGLDTADMLAAQAVMST